MYRGMSHYVSLTVRVGRYLLDQGYLISEIGGNDASMLHESNAWTILTRNPEKKKSLFKKTPVWIALGRLWFNAEVYGANYHNWVLHAVGEDLDPARTLANELRAAFKVRVEVVPVDGLD